jgi:hypothetical protein
MAETRKSIIDEAFMEAEAIEQAFKVNSKEILAHTMGSDIEQMVKESLEGSNGLNEDEDDENVELDLDSDEAGLEAGDDLDLELGDEDEGEMDMDFDLEDEDMDMDSDELDVIDLTGEDDDKIISVFKKMAPEDEIEVVQTEDGVEIKDNETGAEYRIELGGDSEMEMDDMDMELDLDDEDMDMEDMDMDDEEGEEIEYQIELDDEDDEDEDDDMEESYVGKRRQGNKYHGAAHFPTNESVIREVEERNVTPDNVDRYVKGTKISAKHLKTAMDRGDEVKMFSNKEKQTGEGGRHKKVFKVGNSYFKETDALIDGGKAEAMAYLNESRAPKFLKLINENKVLKNKVSSIVSENDTLKEDYNKMVDALKEFRQKLNEVAVFNSNLTYTVRLFTEHSTTKDEKVDIIKRFDDVKSLKESKNVYKNLVKEISKTKAPLKESIDNRLNETKSSGSATEITESKVYVDPQIEKMKALWSYEYKQ